MDNQDSGIKVSPAKQKPKQAVNVYNQRHTQGYDIRLGLKAMITGGHITRSRPPNAWSPPMQVLELLSLLCDSVIGLDSQIKFIAAEIYKKFIPPHLKDIKTAYLEQLAEAEPNSWTEVLEHNVTKQALRLFSCILLAYKLEYNEDDLTESTIHDLVPPQERRKFTLKLLSRSQCRILETIGYELHIPNLHIVTHHTSKILAEYTRLSTNIMFTLSGILLDLAFIMQTHFEQQIGTELSLVEMASGVSLLALMLVFPQHKFSMQAYGLCFICLKKVVPINAARVGKVIHHLARVVRRHVIHRRIQKNLTNVIKRKET